METMHLKKVVTGKCLGLYSNPLQPSSTVFLNIWEMRRRLLEFKERNVVQFLSDAGVQFLNSPRLSLLDFVFYDAPNVFCWWKVWTAGRSVQHLDSSPAKPCCCYGCSVWFSIVLLKYARPSLREMLSGWEHLLLEILFSIDGAFPDA